MIRCAAMLPRGSARRLCAGAAWAWRRPVDRVEVGRVGRQEDPLGAGGADRLADGGALMTAQIVHDDHVAGRQRGDEELLDIGGEALAVDRAVAHAGRIDPVMAQRGEAGQRALLAERSAGDELVPAWRPAADRGHVRPFDCLQGRRSGQAWPSLVDEYQTSGIKPPLLPRAQDADSNGHAGGGAWC